MPAVSARSCSIGPPQNKASAPYFSAMSAPSMSLAGASNSGCFILISFLRDVSYHRKRLFVKRHRLTARGRECYTELQSDGCSSYRSKKRIGRLSMKGKVAIVTGAAKGIGKAIALELAAAGAKVYANGRTLESLSELLGEARERSLDILPLPFDVSKEEEVIRGIGSLETIDYLVNNAAVCPYVQYKDLKEEHWDLMFGVNVKGTYFCTRHALEKMTSPGGSIVNISSGAGKTGGAFVSMPYGTSKAALNNMT
ncbi:MAG TPA: hypothetical protein DF480_04720, partial [Clostridiales bacterium]|nr:hypothetical protein [Clostridiales bacterium]